MKRARTAVVKPKESKITDPRVAEFLARKHADALAKVTMWTEISRNVRNDQTRQLAEVCVASDIGTNFGWMSEQVRAALIEFQLDGWAGVEPTAHTIEYVCDVHPAFVTQYESASQDRNVRKSI
jgi:ABC-type protease/lipase transport system fused ATPase/permease subunit